MPTNKHPLLVKAEEKVAQRVDSTVVGMAIYCLRYIYIYV